MMYEDVPKLESQLMCLACSFRDILKRKIGIIKLVEQHGVTFKSITKNMMIHHLKDFTEI